MAYDYLLYGEIRNKTNTSDYKNKYLFGGKELDQESDLQYFEAKYYNNRLARFNSIDRAFWELGQTERADIGLMDPQRFNSYSYASNNPIIRTDTSGEWWDIAVDSVVAAGGIGYGKITGDEYLVIGAQNMLKDTLKPQNVINPLKKIKKVQKGLVASKKASGFFKNTKYTDKVLKQSSNKKDKQHSFSKHVDGFAARDGKIEKIPNVKGGTNDRLYIEGSHKGIDGTFDYIKDNNGNINHRKFTPNIKKGEK